MHLTYKRNIPQCKPFTLKYIKTFTHTSEQILKGNEHTWAALVTAPRVAVRD